MLTYIAYMDPMGYVIPSNTRVNMGYIVLDNHVCLMDIFNY